MDVSEVQWAPIVAGFLGGGAVGALITQVVTTFRGRKQPVGLHVQSNVVFAADIDGDEFGAVTRLVVTQKETRHEYDNLHSIEVTVQNRGNKDYDKFTFGLTFDVSQSIVRLRKYAPGRLHKIDAQTSIVDNVIGSEIDLVLEPFNRGDAYRAVFQVNVEGGGPARLPEVTSAHPIKFVQPVEALAVVSDTAFAIALSLIRGRFL